MNISRFFIDRPIFATVLSIVITISGLLAMQILPISEYPEVVPPTVQVRATFPGASPETIAETVATPLEEQINGVEDMLYMSSQATADGVMQLTVTFALGTDIDIAQVQVQNRVNQALPRLPGGGAPAGRGRAEELPRSDHGRPPDLAQPPLRRVVSPELRADPDPGRAGAAAGHGQRPDLRRRRLRHADLARSRQGRRPEPDRGGGGPGGAAAERPGLRRHPGGPAPHRARCRSSSPSTPRAGCSTRRSSARW